MQYMLSSEADPRRRPFDGDGMGSVMGLAELGAELCGSAEQERLKHGVGWDAKINQSCRFVSVFVVSLISS